MKNERTERAIQWRNENEETSPRCLKRRSFLRHSAELCRRYNLSEDKLSKWKQQFLENAAGTVFAATD